MNIENRIRQYIVSELNWPGRPQDLADEYQLIANHVVDSLGLMRLVTFLEDEFRVEIDDEELLPTNFGTISSIGALVRLKLAPSVASQ